MPDDSLCGDENPATSDDAMRADFRPLLWLLKLGALVNIYLAAGLLGLANPDPHVVIPGLILLGVCAFRCLFPNRYLDNVVFHDSPLSSIFLTRVIATFSEVAYIYQFSHVIRVLNVEDVGWVNGLSWLMLMQVVLSQGFVWAAILMKRLDLYFYEELGWLIIFLANTAASLFLCASIDTASEGLNLLRLNMLFGALYLPWQALHLRSLRAEARAGTGTATEVRWPEGLRDAIHQRNRRTDAASWGGWIGLTWMVAYWATLIPVWVQYVAIVLSQR